VTELLELLLRPTFVFAAVVYVFLAVRVTRSSPQHANNVIAFFLFLIGTFVAGSAFSFGTEDPNIYGIGRVLSFSASGFLPVAFYIVYRDYTIGPPNLVVVAVLSIIPIATTLTTLLALTNSMHNIVWAVVETESGVRFTDLTDHFWFNRVHAPFMYGLFIYAAFALGGRLPTIASAHRKTVIILLGCIVLPFLTSVGNTVLGFGPSDFPFTSVSLVLLLPLYAYASVSMRFYEFSPVAYQTLFDHVRDPIFVLDHEDRIVCANKNAQNLLGGTERELIGQKLWEDFPEARAILKQASDMDLTQTLRLDNDYIYELSVGPLAGPKGQNLGIVVSRPLRTAYFDLHAIAIAREYASAVCSRIGLRRRISIVALAHWSACRSTSYLNLSRIA